MEEQLIKTIQEPSIKLNKGMKGEYGWEIKVSGNNFKDMIETINETNLEMLKNFKKTKKQGDNKGKK